MPQAPVRRRSVAQGCGTILLMIVSVLFTLEARGGGRILGVALTVILATTLFIRVGWIVTGMIAGVYFGLYFLEPAVSGGTVESQMWDTVYHIIEGVMIGTVVGWIIDASRIPTPDPFARKPPSLDPPGGDR